MLPNEFEPEVIEVPVIIDEQQGDAGLDLSHPDEIIARQVALRESARNKLMTGKPLTANEAGVLAGLL